MADQIDVQVLKQQLQAFADERDWNQFHNPKNLCMALTAEAGELLEIFQWMGDEASLKAHQDAKVKEKTAHELADILLNLVRLADQMEINLSEAVQEKLVINAEKYPAERVRGKCKKYDEY